MMDDLFNNVYVFHKGKKVSITQHWDSPSSRHEYVFGVNVAAMQEVGIIPDDGDWGNMHIEKYGRSLDSLIKVLEGIRDEIDKTHNQSSCQGNVGETQVTTSCAT